MPKMNFVYRYWWKATVLHPETGEPFEISFSTNTNARKYVWKEARNELRRCGYAEPGKLKIVDPIELVREGRP